VKCWIEYFLSPPLPDMKSCVTWASPQSKTTAHNRVKTPVSFFSVTSGTLSHLNGQVLASTEEGRPATSGWVDLGQGGRAARPGARDGHIPGTQTNAIPGGLGPCHTLPSTAVAQCLPPSPMKRTAQDMSGLVSSAPWTPRAQHKYSAPA
jgi:hypothetical protein